VCGSVKLPEFVPSKHHWHCLLIVFFDGAPLQNCVAELESSHITAGDMEEWQCRMPRGGPRQAVGVQGICVCVVSVKSVSGFGVLTCPAWWSAATAGHLLGVLQMMCSYTATPLSYYAAAVDRSPNQTIYSQAGFNK
jgi:hypothetical protein